MGLAILDPHLEHLLVPTSPLGPNIEATITHMILGVSLPTEKIAQPAMTPLAPSIQATLSLNRDLKYEVEADSTCQSFSELLHLLEQAKELRIVSALMLRLTARPYPLLPDIVAIPDLLSPSTCEV